MKPEDVAKLPVIKVGDRVRVKLAYEGEVTGTDPTGWFRVNDANSDYQVNIDPTDLAAVVSVEVIDPPHPLDSWEWKHWDHVIMDGHYAFTRVNHLVTPDENSWQNTGGDEWSDDEVEQHLRSRGGVVFRGTDIVLTVPAAGEAS